MATKAYVLVEVGVGKTTDVVEALQKVEGIKSADPVVGPYDVIAVVEAAELDAIGRLIKQIHSIAGICKTTTCIVVRFP